MMSRLSLLMVCRHNICRSPMAEGLMRHALKHSGLGWKVKVASAGTHVGVPGQRTDERARTVASEHGVKLGRGRSRAIKPRDFQRFDYIFAMDQENLADLLEICPEAYCEKVQLLVDFSGPGGLVGIPDPYYGNLNGFEKVFHLVQEAIDGVLENEVFPKMGIVRP